MSVGFQNSIEASLFRVILYYKSRLEEVTCVRQPSFKKMLAIDRRSLHSSFRLPIVSSLELL